MSETRTLFELPKEKPAEVPSNYRLSDMSK